MCYCYKCGNKLRKGTRFCTKCGTQINWSMFEDERIVQPDPVPVAPREEIVPEPVVNEPVVETPTETVPETAAPVVEESFGYDEPAAPVTEDVTPAEPSGGYYEPADTAPEETEPTHQGGYYQPIDMEEEPVTRQRPIEREERHAPRADRMTRGAPIVEDVPAQQEKGGDKVKRFLSRYKFILIGVLAALVIIAVCLVVFDKDVLTFTNDGPISMYAGTTQTLGINSKKGRTYTSSQLVYEVTDSSVVSVDSSGTLRGLKAGTATVSCKTAKGRSTPATIEVNVKNDVLTLNRNLNVSLTAGESQTVGVTSASGQQYTSYDLEYTSSAPSVATVDTNGVIKAVQAGTAYISVKKRDGTSNIARITVTVKMKPVSISSGTMLLTAKGSKKAPLKVIAGSSTNYYIYFKNKSNSSNDFAFYLAAGKSKTLKVPLGTYVCYYATGQTWYGKKELFGSATYRRKFSQDFTFRIKNNRYMGFKITFSVANGNLPSSYVGSGEFPES